MARLRVQVPATTANVGSGFDCIGMALHSYDELELETTSDPDVLEIQVRGEGADSVPRGETHLVVASIRRGLAAWGAETPGLRLRCHNRIPHSRGLGSSAAAIVGGLALAWGIAHPERELDLPELTRISSKIEGHPDNAGAAVWGGAILAWFDDDSVKLVQLKVAPELSTLVWIPAFEVPTAGARSVLPETVPRLDAVAQAMAAATLPMALSHRHDLLLAATRDRLHQDYRASLMRSSHTLVANLRKRGVPATISGAGPTVFAIGTKQQLEASSEVPAMGFEMRSLRPGNGVSLQHL